MSLFPTLASATWVLDFILNNVWLAIGVWAVLYCLDYVFTITAARWYRDGAHQHFVFPEGIELNPFFQDDIAKVRKISFRFCLMLIVISGLFLIVYIVQIPEAFAVLWGMFVGIQLANHCRHLHGLAAYFHSRRPVGLSGKIQYEHWLSLRLAAVDFFCFGLLFLILFLFWGHLFALGAALGCLSLVLRLLMASVKKRKSSAKNEL